MQTIVTARHCEIPESLRERAVSVCERLGQFAPRPMDSAVVFDTDGLAHVAEVRLRASGEVFVAKGDGPDHRTALDRAEEKLRRQLDKRAKRPRAARSRRASEATEA
ncbi:MAG: HPF/RaiA family ribosome-associated protein [Gemmatimonadales bacterium]|nr:HPF/RaiA family ribosome-associated protein [Gemmatimonadales bacterium]